METKPFRLLKGCRRATEEEKKEMCVGFFSNIKKPAKEKLKKQLREKKRNSGKI